jgi:hypothetical protein
MLNLTGIIKNMFNFKGKEQRDSDAIKLEAQTYRQLTIGALSNDSDNDAWSNAKFWVVIDHTIIEVSNALYTGQMLPNGVAQWAVFQNINGVPCHAGYVWDDDNVYVTYAEFKPIKGAWAIYNSMKEVS